MISNKFLADLLDKLEQETRFKSGTNEDNVYFQTLVGLGKLSPGEVIPYLLDILDNTLDWNVCSILYYIVDKEQRPTFSEEIAGRIILVKEVWLEWGREKGYLM